MPLILVVQVVPSLHVTQTTVCSVLLISMVGLFLDVGVPLSGEPGEYQEECKPAEESAGVVCNQGESDAEGEAEDGGGNECYCDGFFDFLDHLFRCQMPSDAVFLCRLPTDSGGPLLACGNEPTEVQNGLQELFLFS